MNCTIGDCLNAAARRGMCNKHYIRHRRHGTTTAQRTEPGAPLNVLRSWIGQRDREGGCWEWPYSLQPSGYGQVRFNGEVWTAHRLAAHLDGRDPTGLFVCHHCDNRRCVNPDHLFLGDVRDNAADMVAKGRSTRGEVRSKLTEAQVHAIRRDVAGGVKQKDLALALGVTPPTVNDIVKGRTWGWLS